MITLNFIPNDLNRFHWRRGQWTPTGKSDPVLYQKTDITRFFHGVGQGRNEQFCAYVIKWDKNYHLTYKYEPNNAWMKLVRHPIAYRKEITHRIISHTDFEADPRRHIRQFVREVRELYKRAKLDH